MKLCVCFLALCLLPLVAGCSRHTGRVDVSGTVSIDGKPLALGSISFQPSDSARTGGGAPIVDGGFALSQANGLKPGDYLVTVTAFRDTGRKVPDPQRGEVADMQPIRFREAMPLPATVSLQGSNRYEFHLSTAPDNAAR